MERWFQYLIGVMALDISHTKETIMGKQQNFLYNQIHILSYLELHKRDLDFLSSPSRAKFNYYKAN